MTNQKAIKENVFDLYSNAKNYEKATVEIKKAADDLGKIIKKYKKAGAYDTESLQSIAEYIRYI